MAEYYKKKKRKVGTIRLLNKKLKLLGVKKCSKCGIIFPIENFKNRWGLCHTCRKAYDAEYHREYRKKNKEKNEEGNRERNKKKSGYRCAKCMHLGIRRGHTEQYSWHRCKVKRELVKNTDWGCRKFEEQTCDYAYGYDIY
jgi:hypothetical protein